MLSLPCLDLLCRTTHTLMYALHRNIVFSRSIVSVCMSGMLLLLPSLLVAQSFRCLGIDTVYAVRWGTGQDFGREFFSQNIMGFPDTNARADGGSVNPRQICSLGMNGEIIVGWKHALLVNRPGIDFTVFENAFLKFDGKPFAEPARIAVSKDGRTFVEFPFDSLTLRGCAGITPVNGDKSPCTPQESGGDGFDLSDIGMDSIRFIRIRDITPWLSARSSHPLWDPTLSGFDLDAVVGLHLVPSANLVSVRSSHTDISTQPHVSYTNGLLTLSIPYSMRGQDIRLSVYSTQGNEVLRAEKRGETEIQYRLDYLAQGLYCALLQTAHSTVRCTFVVLRS